METNPLAGQQVAIDRLGDQGMAEDVAVTARLGDEHLPVDRLAQAVEQLHLVHGGDRGQHRLGDAGTGRGGDREHLLGAPTEPHHPGEQDLLEAGGQRGRAGAVAGQHQFLGEERVAFGAGVDLVHQPGRWVLAEQAGELLGQLVTAEAAQLEPPHAAVAGQLAEQPAEWVQAVQLVAAEGEQHQHRAVAEVGGQVGDQVAGGAVGPVQVLHDQQQRPSRGQPLDHAQQELEQPPLTGARDRGAHGRPVPPGKVGNQAAQLGTGGTGNRFQLVRVEGAGQPAQRLGDRRERHALLAQGHAAAAQHQHALLGGGDGHLLGQPGLADPGLPTDQCHQRLAAGGERQQVAQPRQLVGAADEAPGHDLVRHAAQYARARSARSCRAAPEAGTMPYYSCKGPRCLIGTMVPGLHVHPGWFRGWR